MLFNSHEFIFFFLPGTFALFYALGNQRGRAAAAWLALASVFFYGWWNPAYVALLLLSVCMNFAFGTLLARAGDARLRGLLLFGAVAANLVVLGYYKYAGFLAATFGSLAGIELHLARIVLPLGISFFTFTQIAFLVDSYRGQVREFDFLRYLLFVTYFPHLIAGPVLHHKEIMPQFAHAATFRIDPRNVAVGLTIFLIGLFKKTVLADGVAVYVGPVFDVPGLRPTLIEAWGAALAYTCQLYFDFSGYSDMAIGLSLLFNVRLPVNFNSPYKAVNIVDFWRRWHMTLARFLRDYVYFPLGGNRKGPARRYVNLLATMLLGGLWHGAGWTFVLWGALHGIYLVIAHAWHAVRRRLGHDLSHSTVAGRIAGRALTFVAVVIGWVLFRADGIDSAGHILAGMAGLNGLEWPYGDMKAYAGKIQGMWIAACLGIAFLAPNAVQLTAAYRPTLETLSTAQELYEIHAVWRPSAAWLTVITAIGFAALLGITKVSPFLYFQF